MKQTISYRVLNFLGGFAGLAVLTSAYIIEYGFHQAPCSLCLMQRYLLWGLTFLFFIAGFHAQASLKTRLAYGCSYLILAIAGLGLAIRQIWIQHLPKDAVPNCVADLERIFKFQPLIEAFKTVLTGGGECQESTFQILGFNLAEIAALVFTGFIVYGILLLYQKRRV